MLQHFAEFVGCSVPENTAQIKDKDGGEADNLDEAICPTDMNLICDDDLRTILAPLSNAVKFTMVSDCCHSGSMLDHPEQQIAGSKDPNAPPQGADAMDAGQLMGMFFKGAGVRSPSPPPPAHPLLRPLRHEKNQP